MVAKETGLVFRSSSHSSLHNPFFWARETWRAARPRPMRSCSRTLSYRNTAATWRRCSPCASRPPPEEPRPGAPSLSTAATAAATSFTARVHTKNTTPRSSKPATARVTSVATSAYGPIVFSLDLHDGKAREDDDGNEEEDNNTGRIVCDAVGGGFSDYNRAISETVHTAYGPAEVIYAVLSNGVQGRVEVKLARLQSQDEEVFLGRIVARSKLFDVGCVLFYNEADKGLRVRPGELVPLARHALAVPLHVPLTIELDFCRPSGDEVVRGQLEFKTAIDGLHTERLVGANGAEFEVTISWSEYPW